jgi:threonine dehydrogenase-like Zn-dependent dehydrogenase
MKALVFKKPEEAAVESVAEPVVAEEKLMLKVRMIGLCGSDLNSFRGKNPMVSFPRIPGHEVAATIVKGNSELAAGTDVTMSRYTNCGKCASCRRNRPNACQFNETMGVQRDGAMTEYIAMPAEKLYPARLTTKELCLVEPLTVGFHAIARGRATAQDTVPLLAAEVWDWARLRQRTSPAHRQKSWGGLHHQQPAGLDAP